MPQFRPINADDDEQEGDDNGQTTPRNPGAFMASAGCNSKLANLGNPAMGGPDGRQAQMGMAGGSGGPQEWEWLTMSL